MVSLTYAQKRAFGEMIVSLIRDNADELKAVGFDVRRELTVLERAGRSAVKLDVRQEQLKAELEEATEVAVKALNFFYERASSMTDAMVGLLGKKAALAKRLRNLRDEMILEALRGKRRPKAKAQ